MPSSYLRLAAHRVAHHYFLHSMVVDSGSVEGTRIVARKNAESRYPTIRLADIPVDGPEEEKPAALSMPKVAIKQRPSKWGKANGDGSGCAGGNRLNASKSVEERKEEYNKARARIFSNEMAGKVGEVEVVAALDETRVVEYYSVEDVLKVDDKYKGVEESPDIASLQDYSLSDGRSRECLEKESFNRGKQNSGTNSRVAIFRDREKDRKDPDYDRNYDRSVCRFSTPRVFAFLHPQWLAGLSEFCFLRVFPTVVCLLSQSICYLSGPEPWQMAGSEFSCDLLTFL